MISDDPRKIGVELEERGAKLAPLWGVVGVAALLAQSIRRVLPTALAGFDEQLPVWGWAAAAAWIAAMAYFEGYRGFQRGFVPRVLGRAGELAKGGRLAHALLAPLYCMSLFAATRRRMIVSWSLVVGITGLVIGVRAVPQPWRGVIDAGVVVGLGWGLVALVGSAVGLVTRRRSAARSPGSAPR